MTKHQTHLLSLAILMFLNAWTFSHSNTISLSGEWMLAYDEENYGERFEWFLDAKFPSRNASVVQVPSSWEIYRKNYEGIAWYRKEFTVGRSLEGKSIRLHFDAVNYIAKVYLNGQAIGFHEGGYTPFEFRVDDLIKFGEKNILTVRVTSPVVYYDDIEIDGLVKDEAPHWRGALTAGIWQDVRLIITERLYTKDVFIEPFIDGRIKINMNVFCALPVGQDAKVDYKIINQQSGKTVWKLKQVQTIKTGHNPYVLEAEISSPLLWSPDDPNLYRLEVSINEADPFTVRFGVREIAIKDDGFYLNGKKFYMKSAFWEQLYPIGLALPDSPEMVKEEIRLAKEAGFNVLRFWRRPPAPYILDLCDEMGIATIGAPAAESMNRKPLPVPEMPSRVAYELESMVLRDRNHPSLIMWEVFNELKMPELIRIMHECCLIVRKSDPTRIIFDESGGWAGPPKAYPPYSREGITINEDHLYLKAPVTQAIYDDLNHLGQPDYEEIWRIKKGVLNEITPDVVSVISEIGYGGMPNLESNLKEFREKGNPITAPYFAHEKLYTTLEAIMEPSGLDSVFDSIEQLCLASQEIQAEGNKLQFEAVRLNPAVHGYCLHAFTGGDYVYGAGILDLWRHPKKAYYTMKEVNQPFYISARVEPRNTYPGDAVALKVSTVNENAPRSGKVEVSLVGDDGIALFSNTIDISAGQGITEVLDEKLTVPDSASGTCTLTVEFREGEEIVATNSFQMDMFEKRSISLPEIPVVIDPAGKLKSWLNGKGIAYKEGLPATKEALILTTASFLVNDAQIELFRKIIKKVEEGSTLVLLDPPTRPTREFEVETGEIIPGPTRNKFYTENVLPINLFSRNAQGRWIPVNHAVAQHPYFEGLPTRMFMDQLYQNVSADKTIIGLQEKPVVSSVSWDINHIELAYWSIEGFWWGSDLTRVPHQAGNIVISTLNLIDHLGSDPVADYILLNIMEFESGKLHLAPDKH